MPGEDFSLWPGYDPVKEALRFKKEHGYFAAIHPHTFANDWRAHTGRPPMTAAEINAGNVRQAARTAAGALVKNVFGVDPGKVWSAVKKIALGLGIGFVGVGGTALAVKLGGR